MSEQPPPEGKLMSEPQLPSGQELLPCRWCGDMPEASYDTNSVAARCVNNECPVHMAHWMSKKKWNSRADLATPQPGEGFTCECCQRNCEIIIHCNDGHFCNECASGRAAPVAAAQEDESKGVGLDLLYQLVGGRNALRDLDVFNCNVDDHLDGCECFWEQCERWVATTQLQANEKWFTCAACGKQRAMSSLARETFLCRYCFGMTALPTSPVTEGEQK